MIDLYYYSFVHSLTGSCHNSVITEMLEKYQQTEINVFKSGFTHKTLKIEVGIWG